MTGWPFTERISNDWTTDSTAMATHRGRYSESDPVYSGDSFIVIGGLMGRSPMSPPPAGQTPPVHKVEVERLVLRTSPANEGLVIATEERARFVDQIHRAIGSARTWREFQSALPEGEYEPLMELIAENDGEVPDLDDEFSCDRVPGYCAGDYPDWLQAEMDEVVPLDILEAFGTFETTFLNGPYYEIVPSKRDALVKALRERGFVVVVDSELFFT